MRPRPPHLLLVNPPIHDFSAYDFWLKPYGLLRVAGALRHAARLSLFDFLDRLHPLCPPGPWQRSDEWGRGPFPSQPLPKPSALADIPRSWKRFGLPRQHFQEYLRAHGPFDYALVQTVMTYWYPGIREVLEDIRAVAPGTKIVLGGVYTTLCPRHAATLGADLLVEGTALDRLWEFLGLTPDPESPPCWELYPQLQTGVLKLADGCPFRCTYCSVPQVYPRFAGRPLDRSLRELEWLASLGVSQIAFYDDALLHRSREILLPFLSSARRMDRNISLHCPNALNARMIDQETADALVEAGFRTVCLGFESSAYEWQRKTGGKVYSDEFALAIQHLASAGLPSHRITAYLILGHPQGELQAVETSLRFVHQTGARAMLADFSPLPGTPDGEACRPFTDLEEPLNHNKTAFPIRLLGKTEVDRLKALCRTGNEGVLAASGEQGAGK